MMTLDWQVLIVALVAISLQIMTSINLMFGRSAVKKCNIWRETDHSPRDGFRLHGLRGLGDLYDTRTVCSLRLHRMAGIALCAGVARDGSRVPRHGFGVTTPAVDASLTVLSFSRPRTIAIFSWCVPMYRRSRDNSSPRTMTKEPP